MICQRKTRTNPNLSALIAEAKTGTIANLN